MIDYRKNNIWTVYLHIIPKYITEYDYDKYYVGITSRDVKSRWRSNGVGYFGQKYFYNAIKKYGWINIEHYIIANHLTKNEACDMEIKLIKKLHSNDKKYGYNLTNGGDGTYGYKFSVEQIQKMSKMRKGESNSFYGKHHTEDVKRQLSKHHYDCSGYKNPKAKPIYRFDIDYNFIEKFPSAVDADKILGCNFSGGAALQGNLCANSYWAREENIFIDENGIHMKHLPIPIGKKEIFQFDKNWNYVNRYISGGQASKATGINMSGINAGAREKRMSHDYYWVHKDGVEIIDSVPTIKESVKNEIIFNMKEKQNNLVPVVNITTNELFPSLASAAHYYGVKYGNIKVAAQQLALGHERRCSGFKWLLYNDYLKINKTTDKEAKESLFLVE